MSRLRLPLLLWLLLSLPAVPAIATHSSHKLPSLAPSRFGDEPLKPLLAIPEQNPDKVALGRQLFFDTRLSREQKLSCASCHDLDSNGADHRAFSLGHQGQPLALNTPSIFNSALNPWQFWDGRAHSLEEQIDFVIKNPREMASNWPLIIGRLQQDADYRRQFHRLYGSEIRAEHIQDAIACFERTLLTPDSRFDRWLRGYDTALTEQEKRGYRLFKSYGCSACHQGANIGGNLFQKIGIFADFFARRKSIRPEDNGRYNVTGREQDRYVFRVPSLRNVAVTAPYFHDGSVSDLREAIRLVARYQLGRHIPEPDIEDIHAFLLTLTGNYNGRPLHAAAAP